MGLTAIGLSAVFSWLTAAGAVHYVDLESDWKYQTKGPWAVRVDHRKLLAMHHPWTPSSSGNLAMASREVAIPEGWTGPLSLAFYSSDDYHTLPDDPAASGLAADAFIGHRRRQVLINDTVVWSADVSDPVKPGASPHLQVPLSLPEGTQTLRIALVAYDAIASTEIAQEDYFRPSKAGLSRENDPDANRFRTAIYWGDLALVSGDSTPSALPRPTEKRVLERHNRTWPPGADTALWAGKTFDLSVSAPGGIPAAGFPLEMGLPLPEGVVGGPDGFRFRRGGSGQFVQKSVSGTWFDGSPRWVQVRLPVTDQTKKLELSFEDDGARSRKQIEVTAEERGPLRLDTGSVGLTLGGLDLVEGVTWNGKNVVESIRLAMEIAGEVTPGTGDDWQILEEGPFFVRALLNGRFDSLTAARGSFELYVSVYEGLPYVRMWLRVFNDTDANLDLSHLRMHVNVPTAPAAVVLPHGEVTGDFRLEQRDADGYHVSGNKHASQRPFFLGWENGALAVKHFRELFPKGVSREGNIIGLDLFAGGNSPVTLTPGEAKSHEIWFGLGKQDGAALAAAVEQPPLLQNAEYWCASGALGPAAPLAEERPYARHLADAYGGKTWHELGQSTGLRHFPDAPYLGKRNAWANDHDGRMMGLWSTWAMTGDRNWFDRAAAVSAHLQDVAIVHTEVPGQSWLGAMHGPGANHVAGPWNPALRAEGLALYGHLTGNPSARAEFLGVADYIVRSGAGIRGANARHMAAPFATISAAYRETGEVSFLEAGAERLTAMLLRVDRRRGVWFDWHGSETYPGTVPWMAAQLAGPLYSWYQLTGDVEAAQLLVGLAEALVCENTPWETPGAMRTYSPNPRYPSAVAMDPFIIPLLCAAYELSEDDFFRDAARAQWARWQAAPEFQPVFNLAWHWPWLNACVDGALTPKSE